MRTSHTRNTLHGISSLRMHTELDHMQNALTATVEEWTLLLARKLYVFLGKGPINLRSQIFKPDKSFCVVAQHQANLVRMRYRGIEFYIHQITENRWNWHIPTRMEISTPIAGVVGGNKEATIAKCHLVIDERLGLDRGSAARSSRPPLCKHWQIALRTTRASRLA